MTSLKFFLSLFFVIVDPIWSHEEVMTREELTQEVQRLDDRLGKRELADDIGRLREDLTQAIETMGQTLGEKLTEGLEKLRETLSANANKTRTTEPSNCFDVREHDVTNGVHTLTVNSRNVTVFCDQYTAGGGWAVIQRRRDGSVDFYRDWQQYKEGFGDLNGEFWLGLDNMHLLTTARPQILRVDLNDFEGNTAYAEYKGFIVSGPDNYYRLSVDRYSGNAGDSIGPMQNNQPFSTKDRDHDSYNANCAVNYHGAWWYKSCYYSNLNGRYLSSGQENEQSVNWYTWKGNRHIALKHVEMKIRPAM